MTFLTPSSQPINPPIGRTGNKVTGTTANEFFSIRRRSKSSLEIRRTHGMMISPVMSPTIEPRNVPFEN